MRILYYTDCHYDDISPRSRLDNYQEAILNKLKDIVKISRAYKPDYIIDGGDLFNRPSHNIQMVMRLADVLQNFYKVPNVVLGNHEWRGSWDDWKERSGLTLLNKMGIIRLEESGEFWIDNIISTHKCLVPHPVPWSAITYEEFAETCDAKVVLVSDYHDAVGTTKIVNSKGDTVTFIAPGAVSRRTCGKGDIERTPTCVVLDFDPYTHELDEKYIEIEHEPADKVLRNPNLDLPDYSVEEVILSNAVELFKEYNRDVRLHTLEEVLKYIISLSPVELRQSIINRCKARLEK